MLFTLLSIWFLLFQTFKEFGIKAFPGRGGVRALWPTSDVHHCSKFFQSDARATETLKIESPDQPGWSLSIYNLFERLSWQMALFSLWWTTPSTDPLLTNCNIPPSFYQLYTFRASKSILLALPRLKVLLMDNFHHEIKVNVIFLAFLQKKFLANQRHLRYIGKIQNTPSCLVLSDRNQQN